MIVIMARTVFHAEKLWNRTVAAHERKKLNDLIDQFNDGNQCELNGNVYSIIKGSE